MNTLDRRLSALERANKSLFADAHIAIYLNDDGTMKISDIGGNSRLDGQTVAQNDERVAHAIEASRSISTAVFGGSGGIEVVHHATDDERAEFAQVIRSGGLLAMLEDSPRLETVGEYMERRARESAERT